jgi:tRNA (guanine37-N1)-methyltransferase
MASIAPAAPHSGASVKPHMRFDILTIFPEIFDSYLNESMFKRAKAKNILDIRIHDIRKFSKDRHKKVDAIPYGGGPGMVMTPQPLYDAIRHVQKQNKGPVMYLSPKGKTLTHKKAQLLAQHEGLILVCGRYEGIDQRVIDLCVDEELSIGKYVLTGGELPALVVLDAVARFVPSFIGKHESVMEESFSQALEGKKEYPHYTRPPVFKGRKVPEVLQSGHHAKIREWRKKNLS